MCTGWRGRGGLLPGMDRRACPPLCFSVQREAREEVATETAKQEANVARKADAVLAEPRLLTLWLTGFTTGASDEKPIVRLTCRPLVNDDKDFQKKVAAELKTLPPNSALLKLIIEYSKQPDASRAIGAR